MCGICGIVYFNGHKSGLSEPLVKMNNSLIHRGPDDEGYVLITQEKVTPYAGNETSHTQPDPRIPYFPVNHIDSVKNVALNAGFGFRRLSILDLSIHGHQPMSYLDRYWIVFNGEIYNYVELREELRRYNYNFETGSDTEVILAAYDRWGKDCLQHFNGMWAIVIYDAYTKRIFMSRDRFGVKPIVYYLDQEKLIFASEIKALHHSGLFETAPNLPYIDMFLHDDSKEYITETSFNDINKFPAGCFAEFDINDFNPTKFQPIKYYSFSVNLLNEPFIQSKVNAYAEEYLTLLEDAVKLRLRADVPIGTCLSGGMDSTSIVWFINNIFKENHITDKQKTFSLVFDTDERTKYANESVYIDDLIKLLDLDAHKISPTAEDVKNMYAKSVYAMDNPQVASLMSYMFTYKLVRDNHVTITLDGQGADEQQVGYIPYLMNYFANQTLIKSFNERKIYLNQPVYSRNYILGSLFRTLRVFGLRDFTKALLISNNKFTDPFIPLNLRLQNDINGNLINLFHFGDRGSMAFSVESRFPMMDYRLVEFWMKMPVCYKVHEGYTKYVARVAMNGKLPDSIVWRRDKMGWETPQKVWFRQDLKDWFDSTIINSEFLHETLKINKKNLQKALTVNIPTSHEMKFLIKLHNLALWHSIFFENQKI